MKVSLLALLCLALASCKPVPEPERVITGQAFIRTKGGQNRTLGAVRIILVPSALAIEREQKTEADFKKDIATATAAHSAYEAELETREAVFNVAESRKRAILAESVKLQTILSGNAKGMASLPVKEREKVAAANVEGFRRVKELEQETVTAGKEWDKALTELGSVRRRKPAGPDDILALVPRLAELKWPEVVAETLTDSDGRFSLRIKAGEFSVIANAERPLPLTDKVELYFWRVPVGQGPQSTLILSDENARAMTAYYAGTEKEKQP